MSTILISLPLPLFLPIFILPLAYFLLLPRFYPQNLPPGPRASLWGWGNHRHLIPRERPWLKLWELEKEAAWEQGGGKGRGFYTVWTGPKPTIVVSSPRVAADLLDRRSKIYSSRPRFVVMGELATGGNALLFLPYGSKWLNQRKLYHQALAGKAADTYRPIQELEAKRLCHDLMNLTSPDGWEKHIQRFAASSVVAIAYGRRVDDVNVGFVQSVIQRMEEVGRTNLPGKQILDSYPFLQSLPEFLTPYKKTYRAARLEGHSFWMSLANTVKERMEKGTAAPSFTRDLWERRGEIGINDEEFGLLTGGIFGAGVETTAGTLIAFVLAMVTHPEAQFKAQEELDRVVGMERSPTWDDEVNLPYCRALMKEVLRWRPVAVLGGTPHASTEDDVYEGFFIPKGSTILCNLWAIHHDEEYFPDPDKFDPQRYMTGPATAYPQKHGHSAFGWGRRICPGQHVAERGVFIVILHLLHQFTLSTPKGRPAPDVFAFTDGFNSRAEPFPLAVEVRGAVGEREKMRKLIEREKESAWEDLQVFEA